MKDIQEQLPSNTTNVLKMYEDPSRLLAFDPNARNVATSVEIGMAKIEEDIKKLYPKLSPDERQFAIDAIYGPIAIKLSAFVTEKKNDLAERSSLNREKTHSARVQHLFTDAVIQASGENADIVQTQKIYRILQMYKRLSSTEFGNKMEMQSFWSGIRAEIGVTKALRSGKFEVYLPDYTPLGWNQDYQQSEVYTWDVDNGIDCVAEKEGHIFLIDVKGRKKMTDPESGREVIRNKIDIVLSQPYEVSRASLRRAKGIEEILSKHSDPVLHRMQVVVPTDEDQLGGLMPVETQQQLKSAMRIFGRLKNEHAAGIIMGLDGIISQSSQYGTKGLNNERQVA